MNRLILKAQNENIPFYPTVSDVKSIPTPVDHFPFSRFYTGDYKSNDVVFFDRQAGYSRLDNLNYRKPAYFSNSLSTNYCWQPPPSVTLPCVPTEETIVPIVPPQ